VAAKREGWDAARWVRHLAAKLGGHQDVLPPGAGSDDGAPPARATQVAPAAVEPEPVDEAPAFEPSVELALNDEPTAQDDNDVSTDFDAPGSDLDFGDLSEEMKALLAGEA